MSIKITVDGYSERWLRRGFPWVYPKEIGKVRVQRGAEVEVVSKGGEKLGRGLFDTGWISVRVMRHDNGPLDAAWLHSRLDRALALRRMVVDARTDGFRVVSAENDGLPGIRVDRWGTHAVITVDSPALASLVEPIADWCVDRLGVVGVHLALRRDPRDTDSDSDLPLGPIRGEAPGEIEVTERGLRYGCRPAEAPDVGLYADMREVRAWLEPHWKDRRVLNLFAFTGAFSVSALAHGARSATTVDLSQGVLDRAASNLARNGLESPSESFVVDDSFRALDRMRRKNERFDVVVCDPPSFSRTPDGQVWSAAKDIPRLAAACARVLDPDGWLVFASNSGELSPHAFRGEVDEGLRKADRVGQELFFGGQGPDFPVQTNFPEGRYLKVGVWRLS